MSTPMNIRHILITTDLSPEALRPFAPILGLARKLEARITVLNVVPCYTVVAHGAPLAPPLPIGDTREERRKALASLEDLIKSLDSDIPIEPVVIEGEIIHDAIADYAEKHEVDLIAMSTHGRTGFRRIAMGSVAEAVLRHSSVPVVSFPISES